jgi:hypothetical protein
VIPSALQGNTTIAEYRGAPQTIALIKRAVYDSQHKPVVRQVVEELVKHLPSKDTVSEALAIYHFVIANTRYMRDPRNAEYVRAPWLILGQIMAGHTPSVDCDDMTGLICALAAVTGADCRAVTVAFAHQHYQGQRQYSHVFAQVREPRTGSWITLDPVAGEKTNEMFGRVVAAKFWPIT